METRKVQQTGGSSFIVSLPKEWIRKRDIKKNDLLGIISQPDGNLLVTPKIDSRDIERIKVFDIDEIKDIEFLFRLLIGSYIMGYSEFVIKSSRKIESKTREKIIYFTQIVIGPEIIDETANQITLKDLLNPKEMPFHKTIKRMYIMAESMHLDAIKALKTKNQELLEEIIKRDDHIDRLQWLISRQTNIALRDIILAQRMEVTLQEAHFYHLISRLLERIADHAVNLAKNVMKLNKYNISDKIVEDISNASKIAISQLNNSLDALLQKNINKANTNIESVQELISSCEKINQITDQNNLQSSIALSYVIESIRRTGEYSSDISELIIDYLVN
ncbi:MAG: PhoU domain-containing protein [Promethearchaeota archaeon]